MRADEDFKRIKGFEKYYLISNHGRVVSLHNRGRKFLELKQYRQHNGYLVVHLRNGHRAKRRVHRLVAEHFLENDDEFLKTEVHHRNGNRRDNHVENLEWCTPLENLKWRRWDSEREHE